MRFGAGQIEGQLLELFSVSIKAKTEDLFEPEHIGNQRRTLLFGFVLAQQPEQEDEQNKKQADGQLEGCQIPV
ncbi:MAG: hypothetical protein IPP85_14285 [Propionivibrio sp.]|nr:hypothetical protein [Propionivibrio sp.]